MQYASEEEREQWFLDFYAPLTGADPDNVPEEIVEQEMSMFYSLKRQTEGGGTG